MTQPPKNHHATFVAWVRYMPDRKPDRMAGYEMLEVVPEPWPVVLTGYDPQTDEYQMLPFGIPLGKGWEIHAWAPLPDVKDKVA